jgi:hypothetical protein
MRMHVRVCMKMGILTVISAMLCMCVLVCVCMRQVYAHGHGCEARV